MSLCHSFNTVWRFNTTESSDTWGFLYSWHMWVFYLNCDSSPERPFLSQLVIPLSQRFTNGNYTDNILIQWWKPKHIVNICPDFLLRHKSHISSETVYGKLKQISANKLDWLSPKCSLRQPHVHTGLRCPKQTCENITQQDDNPCLSQFIELQTQCLWHNAASVIHLS